MEARYTAVARSSDTDVRSSSSRIPSLGCSDELTGNGYRKGAGAGKRLQPQLEVSARDPPGMTVDIKRLPTHEAHKR